MELEQAEPVASGTTDAAVCEAVNWFTEMFSLFKVHAESGNYLHLWFTRELCSEERNARVGSGRVASGRVGSGRVGSGRVGSGRVGSGRVGSGRVGSGRMKGALIYLWRITNGLVYIVNTNW